ncbi:MAG: hypothetical protein JXB85_17675 [Anaerolineales bacterium]|nr:hypothetical protein [Anaerolineales bacterium]
MTPPVIATDKLSRHGKVPVREAGLKAATTSLFKRTYTQPASWPNSRSMT